VPFVVGGFLFEHQSAQLAAEETTATARLPLIAEKKAS
jgi:hypothetical protein